MNKLSLVSIILILRFISSSAQSCLPEGITFETQTQIDSFQINYPGCTEIEGDVTVYGGGINNLNGLSVLTSLGGNLSINCTNNLHELTGLDNITAINGDLWMAYNDSLTSITGLESLIIIEGNLNIGDGDYTGIPSNPLLSSLSGLCNLSYIGGDLEIYGWYNFVLTNLDGLENLVYVGGDLWFHYNDSVKSLTGLNNLTSIGGLLWIYGNPKINSLEAMDNIEPGSITNLRIEYNYELSTCNIQSICDYLAAPGGSIVINENATGCNSPGEVQDSCIANSVSIDEQLLKTSLTIYPNPAHQDINISADGFEIDNVNLFTLTGHKILQKRPVNGKVDISDLTPGMYIVEVTVENTRLRKKLLVQR